MQDLEGKTAVVTGAASGMGFAFADCFADEGMNVVLADIEEKSLREAGARIEAAGGTVLLVPTDVSDEASMDHLGVATRECFGAAHVVCLNAGVAGGGGPMETLTTNDWKWGLDVNLWGVIHGIRVFLAGLKAQNEGHLVITASVAGLTSYPGSGPYNASKHAAVTIAETLHAELAEERSAVGVSCLCPGRVATRIHESDRNRPKELIDEDAPLPDEEARQILSGVFALGKPPAEVAELVLRAVVKEQFWIQTDEVFREPIRARHESIENATEPPARGNILAPYFS